MEHFQVPLGSGGVFPFTLCWISNMAVGKAGRPFQKRAKSDEWGWIWGASQHQQAQDPTEKPDKENDDRHFTVEQKPEKMPSAFRN